MQYNHKKIHPVHTLTQNDFTTFLLDNIEDPINRSLNTQQRFENTRQLQSQTVQQFSAYLEGVEAQLSYPYSKPQRVTHFFAKMRPELQIQITNIESNLSKTKAALLALTVRLKVNIQKTNPNYVKAKNNHNKEEGQRGQGEKKRRRNKGNNSRGEEQDDKNKDQESRSQRRRKDNSKPKEKGDYSHLTCYNYSEPGHISTNYPNPKKEQPKIGGVTQIGDYEVSFKPKNERPSSKTPQRPEQKKGS